MSLVYNVTFKIIFVICLILTTESVLILYFSVHNQINIPRFAKRQQTLLQCTTNLTRIGVPTPRVLRCPRGHQLNATIDIECREPCA